MVALELALHSVMYYRPKLLKHKIDKREHFSICFIFEGEYLYLQGGEELHIKAGSAIFLPKGSKYLYNILTPSEKTMVGQITFDFSVSDPISNLPTKVTSIESADELFDIFNKILKIHNEDSKADCLEMLSLLAKMINESVRIIRGAQTDLLSKAEEYIRQNRNCKISLASIAKICHLSESQFRKRFTERYGISPVKYKNRLRIEQACRLLNTEQFNIAEVSRALSFDTPYAFSKTFKSMMGISPKKYASTKKAKQYLNQ